MTTSSDLFMRAQKCIPGGVNSPVRAFKGVGGDPIFFARGSGAYVFDEDGKRYIDYVGSWGPMILGHAHPKVMAAVKEAMEHGLGFGAPTRLPGRRAGLAGRPPRPPPTRAGWTRPRRRRCASCSVSLARKSPA